MRRCAHRERKERPQPKEKGTIWLITCGSRGDHEPIAALAYGLQAAGHRVKVFGQGYMQKLFQGLGLDFEGATRPPVLNPGNPLRASLQSRALAAGFEGDGGLVEYLLDTAILETEHCIGFTRHLAREGKSEIEILMRFFPVMAEAAEVLSGRLDKWEERNRTWLQSVAHETKMSVESCAACRRDFRALWQKLAAEKGVDALTAYDAYDLLIPPTTKELMTERLSWKYSKDLSEWWQSWEQRNPGWFQRGVPDWVTPTDAFHKRGLDNLLFSFDSAQHKPDVLIYHYLSSTHAWGLRHLRGVSLQPFAVTPDFPWPVKARIGIYKMLMDGERKAGRGTPLASAGVFRFMSVQESPWNLVGLSPLRLHPEDYSQRLNDSKDWYTTVRACFTGSWTLDAVPQEVMEGPELAELFGSAADRERLERFLAEVEGEPPIYIGWGSMGHSKGAAPLASLVVKTLRLTGHRAVFVMGWSGVSTEHLEEAFRVEYPSGGREEAEARLLVLRVMRPEQLLPRCVAAVHHGGAGTAHAVLRAGIPAIVTPVLFDQPSNGVWVELLGCGLSANALEAVTAEELAEKLKNVVGNKEMKATAEAIASQMRDEPGVAGAVRLVEKFLREQPEQDAAMPVEARDCPDGNYAMFDRSGNPIASLPVRSGTAYADVGGVPQPVCTMRWGKFLMRQEGTQELLPYSVQMVDLVQDRFDQGNLSSNGKTITTIGEPHVRLEVPSRWRCTVS